MITKKDNVVALLDGDILAVRAAAVNEGGDPEDIEGTLHYLIREWTEYASADTCKVFVSEGKCFRYQAYPDYKNNRKDKPKPPGTDYAKAYLLDVYDQEYSDPLLEADDRMGLYATEEPEDEVRIIVSTDKDMRQVPAWQVSPDHHRFPFLPRSFQCLRWRVEQTMTGDRVDGYPGIPGFGPSKFDKWWDEQELGAVWPLVRGRFAEADLDEAHFTSQLHCATILHNYLDPDYLAQITELYGLTAV